MGCTFTFDAHVENIDTEEKILVPGLLALLDGIAERSDFAQYLHETDLTSKLQVRSAIPTLRFDKANGDLLLEIIFGTDRRPSDKDVEQLAAYCTKQIEGGWGMNYEFALPPQFQDCQVHFESEPREQFLTPELDLVSHIVAKWKGWDYDTLAGLSDSVLVALTESLKPHVVRDYTASGVTRQAWDLYESAQAQIQRRWVGAKADNSPQVSLENLDELDKLPDDTF